MKQVFVDAGALFAYAAPSDQNHEKARAIMHIARSRGWRLHTVNTVLFETYALVRVKVADGEAAAHRLLADVEAGFCHVEKAQRVDEIRAEDLVESRPDLPNSFADALTFAVMDRLGIREVISFDRRIQEYGDVKVV